jgi:hypothetical protein
MINATVRQLWGWERFHPTTFQQGSPGIDVDAGLRLIF